MKYVRGVIAGLVPAIRALISAEQRERRGCPRQAQAWLLWKVLCTVTWSNFPHGSLA